jgi:glycosyltransferase involved in cell wall biosynthesis
VQPQSNSSPETPNEPEVSVVIVSWNCIEALRRCLLALNASHQRQRIEVLVVDAGSRDGSGQVDTEFSNVTVHRLPRNFGKTRARNIGSRTAKAELILFLDPEVEVTPGTVKALVGALASNDQAVAALPRLVDEAGLPSPIGSCLPDRAALAAACRANSGLSLGPAAETVELGSDAALLVRKSFLRGTNFLDEKRYSEFWAELELFWRIQSAGKRAVIAGEPATLNARRTTVRIPRAEEALLASDRVAGAAAFVSKREGWGGRVSFLAGQFFGALGMAFREPGYGLRLAFGILTGSRIDGTQGGELG